MVQDISGCTRQLWFILVALIIGFVAATIFGVNAFYFSRIQAAGGCGNAISKNNSTLMLWLNIILAIISGILAIYGLVRLVLYYERSKQIPQETKTVQKQKVVKQKIVKPTAQQDIGVSTTSLDAASLQENVQQVETATRLEQEAFNPLV